MKTISEQQKEKYDLKAKHNGYKILDYDEFHEKTTNTEILIFVGIIICFILGIIVGYASSLGV